MSYVVISSFEDVDTGDLQAEGESVAVFSAEAEAQEEQRARLRDDGDGHEVAVVRLDPRDRGRAGVVVDRGVGEDRARVGVAVRAEAVARLVAARETARRGGWDRRVSLPYSTYFANILSICSATNSMPAWLK